ncbi:hypothetical protein ACQY0O_001772 [Thecaphora frezii]
MRRRGAQDAWRRVWPAALIGMLDECQLSLNFTPECRILLRLTVSTPSTTPSPTPSPTPSLSNGSDVTPASTPSAGILLTFDDAATAPSAPSPASLPCRRLLRVGRFPLCTTLPCFSGQGKGPVSRQDDKVNTLANSLPLLSLDDDTASVTDLDIQRQSIESNIVDPAFIPTAHHQDNEEPQRTEDAPFDDLETIYENDEEDDEACFPLEKPFDVFTSDGEDDIAVSLPERPSAPMSFYFLEHDASLATTPGIREIDDMEPSCDSSNSSHYDDLLELISSSNLGDSGNTEPMDGDLLSLVEPMEEPLPLPEIQIEGIPLCLLDDAWECKPEHQHQHQHEYVGDAEEQCFWSDDSDKTEPTPSWACMPTPLPSAFCKCTNEAQDTSCLGAARAWC